MVKRALFLSGGGARGAYQAGVLKAISHILQVKALPFSIITGVSVGTINAALIAQYADNFALGVDKLETLWREISCQQIFNSSNYELSKSMLRNLGYLFVKQRQHGFILDTSPLHQLIEKNIDFKRINHMISARYLDTLETISSCYERQQTISFYQHSNKDFNDWHSPLHVSERCELGIKHILASSAIPLFFPTIEINGFHYGDGSMGLVSPLRGALRLNAEKIMIIGTRQAPSLMHLEQLPNGNLGFAHILGNMLNCLFLDNLDRDIEMVNHMNDVSRLLSIWKKRYSPWRPVETLYLKPSKAMSAIAQAQYQIMPTLLRLLLNALGAQHRSGALLSFLLFEKEFTSELIQLGYEDTLAAAPAIAAFFS